MDNIEDILRALTEDSEPQSEGCGCNSSEGSEGAGGLFDGLDPSMLIGIMSIFESMNKTDDNERFLLALKPLLRYENQSKIDSAVRFMKLFSLLPILKENGLLQKLF